VHYKNNFNLKNIVKNYRKNNYLSSCTKINSKCIKNLNVSSEILILLWENTIQAWVRFSEWVSSSPGNKNKKIQLGLYKAKKLLHNKKSIEDIKETAYRVVERFFQTFI
jgi:hypothetical protein